MSLAVHVADLTPGDLLDGNRAAWVVVVDERLIAASTFHRENRRIAKSHRGTIYRGVQSLLGRDHQVRCNRQGDHRYLEQLHKYIGATRECQVGSIAEKVASQTVVGTGWRREGDDPLCWEAGDAYIGTGDPIRPIVKQRHGERCEQCR